MRSCELFSFSGIIEEAVIKKPFTKEKKKKKKEKSDIPSYATSIEVLPF